MLLGNELLALKLWCLYLQLSIPLGCMMLFELFVLQRLKVNFKLSCLGGRLMFLLFLFLCSMYPYRFVAVFASNVQLRPGTMILLAVSVMTLDPGCHFSWTKL